MSNEAAGGRTAAQLSRAAEPLHLAVVSRELIDDLHRRLAEAEDRVAAERRATVERIRAEINATLEKYGWIQEAVIWHDFAAILDAEAQR